MMRVETKSLEQPYHLGSVWIFPDEGQIRVDYHWSSHDGMPERHTRRGVLRLTAGQWGRVRYNGRISRAYYSQPEWYYTKRVFNIGLFDTIDPRVFLDTQPTKIHSQMDRLW